MNKLCTAAGQLGIRRGDLILAAALLLLSAAAGILTLVIRPEPACALVRVNGTEIARLPLDQDGTYRIGSGNTIEISDGKVRMIYADCPDKICVRTGEISAIGQSIVCAPHRVVITIAGSDGKESHHNYDVITN